MMITHELSAEELLPLLRSAWWTTSRTLPDITRMLANSDVIIAARTPPDLAGFTNPA